MEPPTSRTRSRSWPCSPTEHRWMGPQEVDKASERKRSTVYFEDYVIVNGHRHLRTDLPDMLAPIDVSFAERQQSTVKFATLDLESLGREAHQLISLQSTFADTRDQVLWIRDQLQYEREQYRHARSFVQESLEYAFAEFRKLPKPISTAQFMSHFKFHQQEVESDRKRLEERAITVHKLEHAVSNLEFDMQQQEKRLAEGAKATIQLLSNMGVAIPDDAKGAAGSRYRERQFENDRTSFDDVHPLLRSYYGKVGDAKIMQDRLVVFESEYEDARTRIIFDDEHERHAEMTLEELEQVTAQDRLQLRDALRHTIELAETARRACIEADLDPEEYKKALPDETDPHLSKREEGGFSLDAPGPITDDNLEPQDMLRMAFPRAETRDQGRPAVAHVHPYNGSESTNENNVERSKEAVSTWIQDIPDYGTDAPSWLDPDELEVISKSRSDGHESVRNSNLYDNKIYINPEMIFALHFGDTEDRPTLRTRRSSDSEITQRLKNHPEVLKQLEVAIARRNSRLQSQQAFNPG